MKKITSLFIALMMLATLVVVPVSVNASGFDGIPATAFAGGTGTEADPHLISNAAELKRMSDLFNGTSKDYREKFFKLTADIDYGNCEWEPIGHKDGYSLKGGFDGAGHVIRNIKITKPYAEVGFFGYIYGAEVKDLGIENINIKFKTSGTNNVGAFIGYNQAGTITNCYVKNATIHQTDTKTKEASFGAFVGMVRSTAQIENCYIYDAKIASSYQTAMGGFVGSLYDTTAVKINNCFAAEVTPIENPAQNSVYGFGSKNGKSGFTVTNCYSTLASAEGTYSDSYTTVYAESNSLGNAGASKADITTYFNTLDGFAVTSDVNGGYPCLVREVDCVIKSVADNGVVRVIKNIPTAATVYVATYDGYGRLVDVKASPVSEADFTFTPDGLVTSETLKVFVWDGNNSPVADMYTN